MKIITTPVCTEYSQAGHPENPSRISRSCELLKSQQELNIEWIEPDTADDTSILRAHSEQMLQRLNEPEDFDGDTPFYPGIPAHARNSAGAALQAMRLGLKGEVVFSLMRPPGHHAMRGKAMGFCFLNNIAIAALAAKAEGIHQIAIYDFDVHHGNGTEDILLNEEGITFSSIHQHPCYPGTGAKDVGKNCFNHPVPPGISRTDYRKTLSGALEKLLQTKPDLIGVSAGFDAYSGDPLAQGTLESEDFYWLGQKLRETGKPMFHLLEGGYSRALPELILAYLKGLAGK